MCQTYTHTRIPFVRVTSSYCGVATTRGLLTIKKKYRNRGPSFDIFALFLGRCSARTHRVITTRLSCSRCAEDGCGRAFTASHHLKTHRRTHSADKLYACDRPGCDKTFPGKASLKTHQRCHDIWDESETLSDFADDLLRHFDSETNSTTSECSKYQSTFGFALLA